MARDDETIAVYDAKAAEYAEVFARTEIAPELERFMAGLPEGAAVLDLGCGPGKHAAQMHARGFKVTAIDASAAMVKLARAHEGVTVRQAEFSDLNEEEAYDGVWAHFSLLHAPRSEFPAHLLRIAQALKPGGSLHLGMKTGSGEKRDRLGRLYTFHSVEELRLSLDTAGFDVLEEVTGASAGFAGIVDPWVELLARKRDQ